MLRVRTAVAYRSLSVLKQALAVLAVVLIGVIGDQFVPEGHEILYGGLVLVGVFALVLYFLRNGARFRWKRFECPECKVEIPLPLENSKTQSEPILYLCSRCQILWYAGNTASE